jgi:DNA-binding transcriptional LysR family regulator
LLAHGNAIIARLSAARADFEAFGKGALGVLRVGTYQSISTHILPSLMRDFSTAWPDVEVRLSEASTEGLLPQVERGEIDLTFDVLPLSEGPFESVELVRDPYVVLVAAHSPLARRKHAPDRRELATLPWISYRHPRDVAMLEGLLRGQGAEPRVIFRSDDNGAVQGMVGAGLGVALVPNLAVDKRDPSVVALSLDDAVPPRALCLAWHRDRYRSPAARAFTDAAIRLCARSDAGPFT